MKRRPPADYAQNGASETNEFAPNRPCRFCCNGRHLHLETDKIPPMFIARAGRDEVPGVLDSIDRFVAKALAANIALTLMNDPQGVHGFDNQNDDDRSREIIRTAIAFIGAHLGSENSK
jgi:hypothetical protein